jgi:hypothetical protein
VRRFDEFDDALILKLEGQGLGPSAIGRALNPPRQPVSITARLRILARQEARREQAEGMAA